MRLRHALAGLPAVLVLCAAVVVARGGDVSSPLPEALKAGTDVGRARASLMAAAPVGTPTDVVAARLRERGLSCETSRPPLANLTWRVIECSTAPSPSGRTLHVDVAGRNGVLADIGVEDPTCASRADVTDPSVETYDCDLSGKRLLDLEARKRAGVIALLAEVMGTHPPTPGPGR